MLESDPRNTQQTKAVSTSDKPLIVQIDAEGNFALTLPGGQPEPLAMDALVAKVQAIAGQNPEVSVLVGADQSVPYQRVYDTLVLLAEQAKVKKVGLISRPRRVPDLRPAHPRRITSRPLRRASSPARPC